MITRPVLVFFLASGLIFYLMYWVNIETQDTNLLAVLETKIQWEGHSDSQRIDDTDCGARDKVNLPYLLEQDLGHLREDNIFMIESSPKETLSSREGCALESAARNSELGVVMVRVGEMLDLGDNTTCQLYTR